MRSTRKEDVLRLSGGDPALALWPREYDVEWKRCFAAYAGPESDLIAAPLFEDGSVSADAAGGRAHQNPVRIWNLATRGPAIGFALQMAPAYPDEAGEAVGLVVRGKLAAPEPIRAGTKWRIGVDFGTSSTTVMYDSGNGKVKAMPFAARLMALIGPGARQEESARNLYPQQQVTPPFRMLLYEAS